MAARRPIGAILAAVLLAGCGGASAPTPVPAPTPTYTQAQSDACATDGLAFDFGLQAPEAEQLYFSTFGDVNTARKEAAAAAKKDAPIVAKFTGTGEDAEVAALHAALVAGAAAFARPMTGPQFDAAYKAIYDANQAFSDKCREIGSWVQQNVPQ
jgi:hypothetical protein